MKIRSILLAALVLLLLAGCGQGEPGTEDTAVVETIAVTQTVPETAAEEETIPETAAAEYALEQADFEDPVSLLSYEQLKAFGELQFEDFDISYFPIGDLGLTFPQYADLDLDRDGLTDSIIIAESGDPELPITFRLRLGTGAVIPLELKTHGAGVSAKFYFRDLDGSGRDDVLAVLVNHSTAGSILEIALFTDANGTYYRQNITDGLFLMEDLGRDAVRISCTAAPYWEVLPIGGREIKEYLSEDETLFQAFFGYDSVNGVTDYCRVKNLILDGDRLVVMYDFLRKYTACVSHNPFGVVWSLESGKPVIEHIDTGVLREYWG